MERCIWYNWFTGYIAMGLHHEHTADEFKVGKPGGNIERCIIGLINCRTQLDSCVRQLINPIVVYKDTTGMTNHMIMERCIWYNWFTGYIAMGPHHEHTAAEFKVGKPGGNLERFRGTQLRTDGNSQLVCGSERSMCNVTEIRVDVVQSFRQRQDRCWRQAATRMPNGVHDAWHCWVGHMPLT